MICESALQCLRDALENMTKNPNDPIHKTVAQICDAKDSVIRRYRPMFLENDQRDITKDSFLGFLLFKNNQHWDSLHRQEGPMTADMNRLREAIRILVDEGVMTGVPVATWTSKSGTGFYKYLFIFDL